MTQTLPKGKRNMKRKKWNSHGLFRTAFLALLALLVNGCDAQAPAKADVSAAMANPEKFATYWYAGEAELSRYALQQSRYGEPREGEAILVYVTEEFLTEKQVKNESGGTPSTKVLKLNKLKKFETGIYDYSLMTSTFTPIDFRKFPYTLKSTFSSQDWCGQTFSQLNLRDSGLKYQLRSYFEQEGDKERSIEVTYFEDDVWTRMRLEPQMLPLGEIEMIPSQEYMHLMHKEFKHYKAKAVLLLQVGDQHSKQEHYIYRLDYPELGRTIEWVCESKFPFKIIRWEERIKNSGGQTDTTSAELTESIKSSYWQLNSNANKGLRDSLGLQYRWHGK
jgi:hypothetical protein